MYNIYTEYYVKLDVEEKYIVHLFVTMKTR